MSSSGFCPIISSAMSFSSSEPNSSFSSIILAFEHLNQLSPLNKSSLESFCSTTGQMHFSENIVDFPFKGAEANHFPAIIVPAFTTSPFPSHTRLRAMILTHSDNRTLLAFARCLIRSIYSPDKLLPSPIDRGVGASIFAFVSSISTAQPALRLAHDVLCKAETVALTIYGNNFSCIKTPNTSPCRSIELIADPPSSHTSFHNDAMRSSLSCLPRNAVGSTCLHHISFGPPSAK
mmetsp:Transcript_31813/g.67787  ORF Transcript_31813/g.67787 Transcript_31813/m.67787 type:complete len:234 (-) Transcript_31813:1617-2318(-)